MKTIKIIAAIMFLLLVALSIITVFGINSCNSQLGDLQSDYKSHLGDTLVFNNDTLIIIDYDMLNETFTLNNEIELNKDFAKQLIINKKE